MTSKELRKAFLDYFSSKQHKIVESSPLIPQGDPSLLFTTAGMVQFKPHFAGEIELTYTRAASCQKSLRTTDLENVGKTPRHHTFFEMLGNFSFGDYFKEGSIEFAWEFSTQIVKLDPKRIWVSVFEDDDEAYNIWNKKIGIPADKIVRLGKKDNFWGPAGDTGACGPCSELYYDLGDEFSCGDPACKPGCDCSRYLEYWNLVFNQFNYTLEGKFVPLPRTGIDTGMGLERLSLISQGVKSVYETDLFRPFIEKVEALAGAKYEGDNKPAFNVIADHIRAVVFVVSEGILPSNEGRGYVIRRILRRAIRFGKTIGIEKPFMYQLVDIISEMMGDQYPEIRKSADNAKKVIKAEEERFFQTLNSGVNYINNLIAELKKQKDNVLSGEEAFKLYDSMGFPLDLTREIAEDAGLTVDSARFEELMEQQRDRGRQQWKMENSQIEEILKNIPDTEYTGDTKTTDTGKVLLVFNAEGILANGNSGDEIMLVLDKTPFYGESGGQVGDVGTIKSGEMVADIYDTKKHENVIYHLCKIKDGSVKKGDTVEAEVNSVRKKSIARNHSVTHLVQKALKAVLGDHVRQLGSLVQPDRMRFDFSHFAGLKPDEIIRVEEMVNDAIMQNLDVDIKHLSKEDAVKQGALAFFGDKYGETVRVVTMGNYSKELCGGTHVKHTGDIGFFKIVSENSISSGTRRLECVTGKGALDYVNNNIITLRKIEEVINAKGDETPERVENLVRKIKELEKEIKKLKSGASSAKEDIHSKLEKMGNFNVLFMEAPIEDPKDLRTFSDQIKNSLPSYITVLCVKDNEKLQYLSSVSGDNVEKGISAGELVQAINQVTNGKGGGKPLMAQGGGNIPENMDSIRDVLLAYFQQKS